MAAIDKIYVKTWEEYSQFRDWCKSQPKLKDVYGNEESITTYLYKYHEDDWVEDRERPIFMAPYYVDAYVIRNCPLNFIQNELNINYGNYYEEIKNGKLYSSPATSCKYEVGKHFKCITHPARFYNKPLGCKRWFVDIEAPDGLEQRYMWYHEDTDTWNFADEYVISRWSSSNAFVKTVKGLKRKIIKWKLPVGTKVRLTDRYVGDDYEFIVKKH